MLGSCEWEKRQAARSEEDCKQTRTALDGLPGPNILSDCGRSHRLRGACGPALGCRGPPSDQRRARLPDAARVLRGCSGDAGKPQEAHIEAQIQAQVEAAPRKQA
jgi:hypothetical protein